MSALAVEDSGGERRVNYGPSSTTNDLGDTSSRTSAPAATSSLCRYRLETRRVNPKVGRWDGAPTGSSAILLDEDGTAALTSGFLSDGLLPPAPVNGKRFAYVSSFHGGTRADEARVVEINSGTDVEGVDVDLQLRTVVRVSGTIAGPAGPVPGATIVLRPLDWGGNAPSTGRLVAYATDDGRFTFLAVPQGHYELRATRKLPTPGMVSLTANGSTGLPMDDVIMHRQSGFPVRHVAGGRRRGRHGPRDRDERGHDDQRPDPVRRYGRRQRPTIQQLQRLAGRARTAGDRERAIRAARATRRRWRDAVHDAGATRPVHAGIGRGASGWSIESAQVDGGESGIGPFNRHPSHGDVTFTRHPTRRVRHHRRRGGPIR